MYIVQVSCLFSGYFDVQILKQIFVAILTGHPNANIDPRTAANKAIAVRAALTKVFATWAGSTNPNECCVS